MIWRIIKVEVEAEDKSVFTHMASSSMQIHWNKRKCLRMKRSQFKEDWLGTPILPP